MPNGACGAGASLCFPPLLSLGTPVLTSGTSKIYDTSSSDQHLRHHRRCHLYPWSLSSLEAWPGDPHSDQSYFLVAWLFPPPPTPQSIKTLPRGEFPAVSPPPTPSPLPSQSFPAYPFIQHSLGGNRTQALALVRRFCIFQVQTLSGVLYQPHSSYLTENFKKFWF